MSADTLIQVENLQKYYKGGEIKALDGVNADIRRGKVVVVIGPSGSGKSTFLRCLNLLDIPTGGTIRLDGTDITDPKNNINLYRQKMGMVFQHFNLFPHMTILKNMTLAPVKLLHRSQAEAEKKAMELQEKLRKNKFTLTDFYEQMTQLKKMGSLSYIIGMIPGIKASDVEGVGLDDWMLRQMEAIILSMTPYERENPNVLNSSRKKRIAAGSGTQVVDVNRLLKQFDMLQTMTKQFSGGKMPRNMRKMMKKGGKGGMGGLGGMMPGMGGGKFPGLPF